MDYSDRPTTRELERDELVELVVNAVKGLIAESEANMRAAIADATATIMAEIAKNKPRPTVAPRSHKPAKVTCLPFTQALFRDCIIALANTRVGPEEENMVSVTVREADAFLPELFQVYKHCDGTYSYHHLEAGTHEILASNGGVDHPVKFEHEVPRESKTIEIICGDKAMDLSRLTRVTARKHSAPKMNPDVRPIPITMEATKPAEKQPVCIEFEIVDPKESKGDYMSAEDPGSTVSIEDPTDDIRMMLNPGEKVLDAPSVRILYSYPLGTYGPSDDEEKFRGWIFEEKSPNGSYFTREDLVRVISNRYRHMYDEEEGNTKAQMLPGLLNREFTSGKYEIWGHNIGDLVLHTVMQEPDAEPMLLKLGIDS
jgi:hypothetical protein